MAKAAKLRDFTTVIQSSFQEFFQRSSSAGIVILIATAVAMLWVNSPWGESYTHLLHEHVHLAAFNQSFTFSIEHAVNDGLMVIFFLLVGLEIKREMLIGELSTRRKAILPMIAALAGMIGPGSIYALFNLNSGFSHGWGIPVATDIAFALGVLALLGNRVPLSLKVFLAALAIVDDLLAVLVIAIFYTASLNTIALSLAALLVVLLYMGNRLGIQSVKFYGFLGFFLWLAVLYSGIHATIAGVLLALTIPADARIDTSLFVRKARSVVDRLAATSDDTEPHSVQYDQVQALEDMCEGVQSPLSRIEHGLSPWVSFVIMPIFALANAGVLLQPELIVELADPVGLGIILGLFLGKQLGISLAVWGSVKLGIADLPERVTMKQLYGVAVLCGIGFTMALFVANLAFPGSEVLSLAKLSVLVASTLSAVIGSAMLYRWLPPARTEAVRGS